jgi:acyl carrier protein
VTASDPAVESVVRRFLRETLGIDDGPIGSDTALLTTGIVDSVGLVRLAAMLEGAFGFRIPDRDVTAEHFDNLRRIQTYCARRAAG